MFGGKSCPVCGGKMTHFENPSRWKCPKEGTSDHHKTKVAKNQQDRAARNKGNPSNLKKNTRPKHRCQWVTDRSEEYVARNDKVKVIAHQHCPVCQKTRTHTFYRKM
jgi:hypothetical protein